MMSIVKTKYHKILEGPRETVSVHIARKITNDTHRDISDELWQIRAIDRMFDTSRTVFLLFAEKTDELQPVILRLTSMHRDFSYVIVQENIALSLALMTLCKHHIVSSPLSFWGMSLRSSHHW
jgi:hypothetical protein